MRLVQFKTKENSRAVGMVSQDGQVLHILRDVLYLYELVLEADQRALGLAEMVRTRVTDQSIDYQQLYDENRLLLPLDHRDPAHCIISGTGLDHLGSAQARNAMHTKLNSGELTDSMRMFKLGLEGGKPAAGQIGVQPEWFYKGDGDWVVAPGQPLERPVFALDGGEEPELVGLYVINRQGQVLRVGFAIGNEFSDHVLERQNYLYLAHSKLRNSSFGPELLVGDPPANIVGRSRLLRNGQELWAGEFLTGEANMTHTLANIEHHHFKYAHFRRAGDVHCHFYGTATLSFAAGITTQTGDVFEISAPEFGRPLRNPLVASQTADRLVKVRTL
jgi:hypothetical protein